MILKGQVGSLIKSDGSIKPERLIVALIHIILFSLFFSVFLFIYLLFFFFFFFFFLFCHCIFDHCAFVYVCTTRARLLLIQILADVSLAFLGTAKCHILYISDDPLARVRKKEWA